MSATPAKKTTARCSCGSVEFEAIGAPIVSAACYCRDCQEGSRRIEALPNAPVVRDANGGSGYLVYRKDRVRCLKGNHLLQGHKLQVKSATNRVVATCCNSAMLLNFDDAKHWVNIYRARVQADAPPLQIRVCTKFKTGAGELSNDVPNYPSFPVSFLARLLQARIAMLFNR